ncbi:hypothetical protein KO02_17545 [Sphingobacterium sp. ML3W]|uniref:hypothetical protein n=1 Tax=Sphingobacterium sp. ML3W TaxID=1538644 RepID=UPI0004F717A5|nr:hypothetical protein [Sphingobacterium sp. ML3W]AIM38287.1 hypothetical protein KO02_17545 [Sphingobacterium sp. ML3W]
MTLKEEIKWLESYIKKLVKQGAEVIVLRSILSRLKGLDKKEEPSPYHNEAMGFYHEWLKSFDLPVIRNPSQGQALKSILAQLKGASIEKTDESAFLSFKAILVHWDRLNFSLQKYKQLGAINKNLLEIIDKIKNGSTKQQARNLEADAFDAELKQ